MLFRSVLKRHPEVHDAVVVGVPDERFGEAVAALVEPSGAAAVLDEHELTDWARRTLAGYKVPRHLVVVETIGRAPNALIASTRRRRPRPQQSRVLFAGAAPCGGYRRTAALLANAPQWYQCLR